MWKSYNITSQRRNFIRKVRKYIYMKIKSQHTKIYEILRALLKRKFIAIKGTLKRIKISSDNPTLHVKKAEKEKKNPKQEGKICISRSKLVNF